MILLDAALDIAKAAIVAEAAPLTAPARDAIALILTDYERLRADFLLTQDDGK